MYIFLNIYMILFVILKRKWFVVKLVWFIKIKLFLNLKVILIVSIYKLKRVIVLIMFFWLFNYLFCCILDV